MKALGAALPFAVSPALGVAMLLRKKNDNNRSSSSSPASSATPAPAIQSYGGALDPNAPGKRGLG